jgi:hypothetical protein
MIGSGRDTFPVVRLAFKASGGCSERSFVGSTPTLFRQFIERKRTDADPLASAAEAVYLAVSSEGGDHPDPIMVFHEFETWFYETRGKRFLDAYETYVDEFMYPDA